VQPEGGIESRFVDDLLALQTQGQRAGFLREAGLLTQEGLDRLLDVADGLLGNDPGVARRLAELCGGLADAADAPPAVPRANYIIAGACSTLGEFEDDLRFTGAAYDGYVNLGMNLEALRTNVGKMVALFELGRYDEALDSGQVVLDSLRGKGRLQVSPTQRESKLLTALVYQNRGTCFAHMGRYDDALDALAVAEDRYRALDDMGRLGEVIDNRGIILRYLGRGNEALVAHESAAAVFESAGQMLPSALALGNIGETHAQLGNYTRSLEAFDLARRAFGSLDTPVDEHDVLLEMANTYLALNLYPEALATYREADKLLEHPRMRFERARGLWARGSALIACSRFDEAEAALDEAAASLAALDNVPLLSSVMLERASLADTRGDRAAALAKARGALDLVSGGDWPVEQVYARLRLADLLPPDAAEPHLLAARRLADGLALPQLRYRLGERLGHLRRLQGRAEEARAMLEEAVEEIERLRGTVARDTMRASFLRDKTAAYEDLLLLHLGGEGEEATRRAFTVAERAKSRALVDLITGVAEKEPLTSGEPELERRTRALQADLNAVYGGLLGGQGEGASPVPLSELHARAGELEQEISRLRLLFPAAEHDPDPFAALPLSGDLRDRLPSDAVMLAYHVAGDEILAFVSAGGRIRVSRRLGTVGRVEWLLGKLEAQWTRFRAGREFAGRHIAMLEGSARRVLTALYEELVAPLEPLLVEVASSADPVPKLAVVPHGPLHRVPFHALFDGARYLIERFEISYAPSATVYALCQKRGTSGGKTAAVFGVEDPLIPSAAGEARAVAERLPGSVTRVGEEATIEALRRDAPESGVVHLACHGLFRSDNPMFSALKLHDGWLTAADAMSLHIPEALVALSACESGRGEVIGGDEVLGLTRAFLGAGAATLVVSLWLVQDETTARLMDDWYGRLRDGEGRAAALRAAQLGIKERHPHPYYWAPFVLIGKR
jgi:tetratricopeptide (TPR) repeat protein